MLQEVTEGKAVRKRKRNTMKGKPWDSEDSRQVRRVKS